MKKFIVNMSFLLLAIVLILSVSGAALADELIFPPSLTTIEAEAFMGDTSLDRVTIPSGVTAIKARTFANSSLRSITIPASVRSVAADAFSGTSPNIYVEDINSLSGNLAGTVYLTQNSTISSSVSYSGATLVVNAGVTLTVTGSLQGTNLVINGTVVNRGTLRITNEISTSGSGLLSVQNTNTTTELPHNSFYGGLKFSLGTGVQVQVTDQDGNSKTVTAIGLGSHSANITTAGQRVRFCFVPSSSGTYYIYSTGTVDTYVHLLDASGSQITANDDGMGDRNFKLGYQMTAGTVYFYDVRYYNQTSTTGTISFVLNTSVPVTITQQPSNVSVSSGSSVTFSVRAGGGTGTLSYQWQQKASGSTLWQNSSKSGYNTNTLSFTASASDNGLKFRCVVSDSSSSATSNEATLTVSGTVRHYRALLIPEVNFTDGNTPLLSGRTEVSYINTLLNSVKGPTGETYSIYGANLEYEDSSPSEILSAISSVFGSATENDVSLIYITGHGISNLDGGMAGAIATVRTTANRRYCENSRCYDTTDLLLLKELADKLKTINGKVIIWTDTCGSGAGVYASDISGSAYEDDFDNELFTNMVIQTFAEADEGIQEIIEETGELRVSNHFYVLTSSAHKENSLTYVFARALKNAIGTSGSMPADTNPQDGYVTLKELYNYAYDAAVENQHIQVYPSNSSYQLFKR